MSLRQLAKRLDVEIPPALSVTVRGVIQESLQRLAEVGDQCQWGPFQFAVNQVAQRGAMLVDVSVMAAAEEED